MLTRRHLRPEHVHGNDVDEHDPHGRVEEVGLALYKGDGADALVLEAPAVGVAALQLTAHILERCNLMGYIGSYSCPLAESDIVVKYDN